jgi:hypothetical protein
MLPMDWISDLYNLPEVVNVFLIPMDGMLTSTTYLEL